MITNNIPFNTIPCMVVPFYCFLYIDKKSFKISRGKGGRQKLRKFKHKVKHELKYTQNLLYYSLPTKYHSVYQIHQELMAHTPKMSQAIIFIYKSEESFR